MNTHFLIPLQQYPDPIYTLLISIIYLFACSVLLFFSGTIWKKMYIGYRGIQNRM